LLKKLDKSLTITGVVETVEEAINRLQGEPLPDLILMDIQLDDGLCFEIFETIKIDTPVIFTTAYDEYTLRAFKVNSIDYLLKPLDIFEVKRALDKLKRFSRPAALVESDLRNLVSDFMKTSAYRSNFLIPVKGDKLYPLNAGDIAFLYIDHGVVKVFTLDGNSFTMDHTLDELEGMLDPKNFFRANRQFIISAQAIKDIDFWFNYKLSLNLKVSVPEKIIVSKARVPDFKNWFGER
jgi:two-component system LytT family response regulator